MVVELPRDHVVGGPNDQIALFLLQNFELDIGHRCGFFKDPERLDDFSGHRVPAGPRLKIFERTLSLRAPVAIRPDRNFAHAIFFHPSLSHWRLLSAAPFGAVQSSGSGPGSGSILRGTLHPRASRAASK